MTERVVLAPAKIAARRDPARPPSFTRTTAASPFLRGGEAAAHPPF
ncbi:hypothetical protein ACFPK5_34745 [Streptomyces beijiangensis]